MLVHAELPSEAAPPTQPGNIPCNNRRCKTCNILIQSDSFTSPCTGSTHKIRFEFKSTTRNLVYLIQCRRCGLQYVGETGKPASHSHERPPLRHQNEKDRKTCCSPLYSAGPLTGGPADYGDRENLPWRCNPKETPWELLDINPGYNGWNEYRRLRDAATKFNDATKFTDTTKNNGRHLSARHLQGAQKHNHEHYLRTDS